MVELKINSTLAIRSASDFAKITHANCGMWGVVVQMFNSPIVRKDEAFHLSCSEFVKIMGVGRGAFGGFLCYSLDRRAILSTDWILNSSIHPEELFIQALSSVDLHPCLKQNSERSHQHQ